MEGKRRIGDNRSSLFDEFERASVQVRLNQAMLGRSVSEPHGSRNHHRATPVTVQEHHRQSKLPKALKKLLKPIFRRKDGRNTGHDGDIICPRKSLADLLALEQ